MEGVQFVYFEKVLLINIFMNFLILWITSRLIREPMRPWRFMAGATLGGLYSFSLIIPFLSVGVNFTTKLIFSLAMIRVSYPWQGGRSFGKTLIYFYLTSFAFGGTIIALANLLSQQEDLGGVFNHFWGFIWGEIYWVVPLFLLGVIGFGYWAPLLHKVVLHQVYLRKVIIEHQGRSLEAMGFIDSGNQLRDPMTQNPVVLIDHGAIGGILGEELAKKVKEASQDDYWQLIMELKEEEWFGWRVVPFSAVGKADGKLLAFVLDHLILCGENGEKRFSKVMVAISNTPLSNDNKYQVLLHGDLLVE